MQALPLSLWDAGMDSSRSTKNRVVAALSPQDYAQYFTGLRPVQLTLRQSLYKVGAPLEFVYFIEEGIASVITALASGDSVEVGMVGIEGMVGAQAMLGAELSGQQVIIQVPGSALCMRVSECRAAFEASAEVRRVVLKFVDAMLSLSAQTAACNRLHSVEQRCARWLLMASDRIQADVMPMTHEFLATMLGVRRAGVSETAAALQRSGLIRYNRGQIAITDHDGLIAMACECYRLDHDRLQRLLY